MCQLCFPARRRLGYDPGMKKPIKSNLLVWILCIAAWGLATGFCVWLIYAAIQLPVRSTTGFIIGIGLGLLLPRILWPMLRFAKRFEEDEPVKPPTP